MPVRGSLVEKMLSEYGGDAVMRVDDDGLAPEFGLGDYLGVCLPVNRPPRPGDAVVITRDGAPERNGSPLPFELRLYDERAGEPALLALPEDSDEDPLVDGASIWAVAVWLQRNDGTASLFLDGGEVVPIAIEDDILIQATA